MLICYSWSPAFNIVLEAFLLFTCHDCFIWPDLSWLIVFLGFSDDQVSFFKIDVVDALYEDFAWSPSNVETVSKDVCYQCIVIVVV